MKFIIDVNVAVKWYVPENLYEISDVLLSGKHHLYAPDFLLVECHNLLWKKIRLGQITQDYSYEILASLQSGIIRYISSIDLLRNAFGLANILNHPVYDCIYLSASILHSIPIVTSDQRFYKRILASQYKESVIWLADIERVIDLSNSQ